LKLAFSGKVEVKKHKQDQRDTQGTRACKRVQNWKKKG